MKEMPEAQKRGSLSAPGICAANSGGKVPCTVEVWQPTFSNTRPVISAMTPPPPSAPLVLAPRPGRADEAAGGLPVASAAGPRPRPRSPRAPAQICRADASNQARARSFRAAERWPTGSGLSVSSGPSFLGLRHGAAVSYSNGLGLARSSAALTGIKASAANWPMQSPDRRLVLRQFAQVRPLDNPGADARKRHQDGRSHGIRRGKPQGALVRAGTAGGGSVASRPAFGMGFSLGD